MCGKIEVRLVKIQETMNDVLTGMEKQYYKRIFNRKNEKRLMKQNIVGYVNNHDETKSIKFVPENRSVMKCKKQSL